MGIKTEQKFIVMGVFSVLAITPQVLRGSGPDPMVNPWMWWPSILMSLLLVGAMITDYFNRSVQKRCQLVAIAVAMYFLLTWPLVKEGAHLFTRIDRATGDSAQFQWAMMRTAAAFPQVVYATLTSRLMARWSRIGERQTV